jgi:Thiamine pyrophosphate enzyme, N-terminal TPP binding domain
MAQTVAETLVGVLERIGVKQIFALIGDSLNPLADAVRSSSIEWIGVRHEEGAALAASGQAKLTGRLAVCAGTSRAVPIWSRAFTKRRATTRPCSRSPVTCRAKCTASITSKPPIPICCFAMCRSTPKPSCRRSRLPPSSIRQDHWDSLGEARAASASLAGRGPRLSRGFRAGTRRLGPTRGPRVEARHPFAGARRHDERLEVRIDPARIVERASEVEVEIGNDRPC